MALAPAILIAVVAGMPSTTVIAHALAAAALLAVQVTVIRPRLNRRSDRVLAGEDVPRSRAHHAYITLEGAKVLALIVLGVMLIIGQS
jgi:hypothetical protein